MVALVDGGAITVGLEQAGFEVGEHLLIGENSLEANTRHLPHNHPDIKYTPPSTWEDETLSYLRDGIPRDLQHTFVIPACSGLSAVNPHASADAAQNVHFYRGFKILEEVRPMTWTLENAPTLVDRGFPILRDMVRQLGHIYKFTIVSDAAGRHGVAMRRARTMVFGWRRDVFGDAIPIVDPTGEKQPTIRDVFGDLPEDIRQTNVPDHNVLVKFSLCDELPEVMEEAVKIRMNMNIALHSLWKRDPSVLDRVPERDRKRVTRIVGQIEDKTLKWNKAATPLYWDGIAPSMTSMTRLIHPSGKRPCTVREMARLMGFPDDFTFLPDEPRGTHVVQCLAQEVPAPFVKWAATQSRLALEDPAGIKKLGAGPDAVVYQDNKSGKYASFTAEEFCALEAVKIGVLGAEKIKKIPVDVGSTIDF